MRGSTSNENRFSPTPSIAPLTGDFCTTPSFRLSQTSSLVSKLSPAINLRVLTVHRQRSVEERHNWVTTPQIISPSKVVVESIDFNLCFVALLRAIQPFKPAECEVAVYTPPEEISCLIVCFYPSLLSFLSRWCVFELQWHEFQLALHVFTMYFSSKSFKMYNATRWSHIGICFVLPCHGPASLASTTSGSASLLRDLDPRLSTA